jgi:hypothetical protein
MTIDKATYREALLVLIGGTKPVCVHFAASPEGEWSRVTRLKRVGKNYYAKPLSNSDGRYRLIDGLEVRQ